MRISKERKVGKQKKGRKGKLVEKVDEERHEKRRGGEKGGIKKWSDKHRKERTKKTHKKEKQDDNVLKVEN